MQQGGLSDPGWTVNKQCAASARQPIDELLSAGKLHVSSEQGR
jgi:hypothetical protein